MTITHLLKTAHFLMLHLIDYHLLLFFLIVLQRLQYSPSSPLLDIQRAENCQQNQRYQLKAAKGSSLEIFEN